MRRQLRRVPLPAAEMMGGHEQHKPAQHQRRRGAGNAAREFSLRKIGSGCHHNLLCVRAEAQPLRRSGSLVEHNRIMRMNGS